MFLIKVFNFLAKKWKGDNFCFDSEIPFSYFVRLITSKGFQFIYGVIRFRTFKKVFLSINSTIICSSKIHFKDNLIIGPHCYINALSKDGLTLGNNVSLGMYTCIRMTGNLQKIANYIKIGDNVGLGTHGYYGCGVGSLEIGDDTIFGNYVSVHPENHIYSDLAQPIKNQGTFGRGIVIGKNCWIGAKVTILDGTVIGNGCIVAAGAVVTGVFPDNSIIGGVPAKIIKTRI